ncbi:hypothetical protein AVEN_163095-1 [Araneus ventricosus]|uniref:Uncharacterized protein n=1 Tax=Araneus ventricosus TaxID=182803 RepID=A0A4Y2I2L8_ARAVE|nr:hypothetical protein AVEN_163095-1 [Araneus ventricosus]
MFPTSREGHRSAIERRNLGGHLISCERPLCVHRRRRDRLWRPEPPANLVECTSEDFLPTASPPEQVAGLVFLLGRRGKAGGRKVTVIVGGSGTSRVRRVAPETGGSRLR